MHGLSISSFDFNCAVREENAVNIFLRNDINCCLIFTVEMFVVTRHFNLDTNKHVHTDCAYPGPYAIFVSVYSTRQY